MRKLQKWILSALCAAFAFVGVATLQNEKEVATASAAVATEYEVVDTAIMAKIHNEYIPNGNFSLYLIMDDFDMGGREGCVDVNVNLAEEFNKLGFFDKVKIGDKTLREYGCTGFYNNYAFGINEKPSEEVPHNHIRLYCHADPEIWEAAHNDKENGISFSSDVTLAEGTLIPGYSYLMGEANATLYRAGCEFVTTQSTANYGVTAYGETDIESMEYVQGHDGNSGYLGVSLFGDDYLGNGEQVEVNQAYKHHFVSFTNTIELNGLTNQAEYYGLYNLGEAGKGYYSFQVKIPEGELETITIPAGTLFPARGLNTLPSANLLPSGAYGYPLIVYRTQTTQTFYRNSEGKYVSFYAYLEGVKKEIAETYNAKIADCFAEDAAALNDAKAAADAVLLNATTSEEVAAAYNAAKAVFDVVLTKTETIAAAMADLNAYKAEDGYFRDAEKAMREGLIADANAVMENATTKAAIATVVDTTKTAIDGLKTAAQYADEELAGEKLAAKEAISGYKADVVYLEEDAIVYSNAIELGLTAVVSAKNSEEISAAVEAVKTTVDGLQTRQEIVDFVKAGLSAYKAEEGLYREAEATMRASIIAGAIETIEAATTKLAVEEAAMAAVAAIDELKTDEELTAEEKDAANKVLAQNKADALGELNAMKASVDYSKYSAENQAKINTLYKTAKDLINEAMNEGEIKAAVAAFETELNKIPQQEADTTEDDDKDNTSETPDNEDADSADSTDSTTSTDSTDSTTSTNSSAVTDILSQVGCTSTVGISSVMALTVVLGAVGLGMKKRKED